MKVLKSIENSSATLILQIEWRKNRDFVSLPQAAHSVTSFFGSPFLNTL